MESNANCPNDHIAPLPIPTGLSNINLRQEISANEFCTDNLSSSKGYLQDFPNLDQFPFSVSSFNLCTGIQTNIFNPIGPFCQGFSTDFGPFCQGSSPDFDLYEFDEENGSTSAAMQDFQGGGFLKFPGTEDPLMEIETVAEYNDSKHLRLALPDETSCATAADNLGWLEENGSKRSESKSVSTRKCVRGRKTSKSAKGQWTADEDRLLIKLVETYGARKWSFIAPKLKGRIGKQCRERWHNHLRPDIKKDVWTEEEDRILIEVHGKVGNKWAEIAKSLPGRTENTIKNHWNATKRRQFTKRKCRTKWPMPSSFLQDYIKDVFEKEGTSQSRDIQQPTTTTDSGIVGNSSISALKNIGIELNRDEYTVPDYDFDEFTFDEDLFEGTNMDSFMDDIPIGLSAEIDEELCFDVELPFDMPQLM